MNLSAGKFFSKLFGRKQAAPKKVEKKVRVQTESEKPKRRMPRWMIPGSIQEHNDKQAKKAKRVKKSRKSNKLARKQRKMNGRKS